MAIILFYQVCQWLTKHWLEATPVNPTFLICINDCKVWAGIRDAVNSCAFLNDINYLCANLSIYCPNILDFIRLL
jgi:hypothetical protein